MSDCAFFNKLLEQEMAERSGNPVRRGNLQKQKLWEASAKLLSAQIHLAQNHLGIALVEARTAKRDLIDFAKHETSTRIKELCAHSYLVNAEIAIARQDEEGALRECDAAAKLGSSDKTDHAWLILVRVRAYLAQKETGEALREWTELKKLGEVENEHMRKRARDLEAELEKQQAEGFWIGPETENLHIEKWTAQLKGFLVARARSLGGPDKLIAQRLGVTRQLYATWKSRGKLKGR